MSSKLSVWKHSLNISRWVSKSKWENCVILLILCYNQSRLIKTWNKNKKSSKRMVYLRSFEKQKIINNITKIRPTDRFSLHRRSSVWFCCSLCLSVFNLFLCALILSFLVSPLSLSDCPSCRDISSMLDCSLLISSPWVVFVRDRGLRVGRGVLVMCEWESKQE